MIKLPDIKKINEIARQAGTAILKIYDQDFEVMEKADKSPLTEADLAAHHVIVDELQSLTPDIPVLSEESAVIPYDTRSRWQTYWLIDPLDGTTNYLHGFPQYSISIGLQQAQGSH